MNLKPLTYHLFLENVTCVFRNYLCLKKCSRVMVGCWVFIEIFNILGNLAFFLDHLNQAQITVQRMVYIFSVTGFSIYIMLASLYYSERFHKLLSNFDAFYKIFDDGVYFQRMSKAQNVLTFIVVMFCSFKIFMFTVVRVFSSEDNLDLVASTLSDYNIMLCDFRYTFQYFTLHCILFVISEQLRAITRSIDSEISAARANRGCVEHAEHLLSAQAPDQDRLNKLDKWVKAYENINDSSNLCNSMFSVQLTIMLLIVTTYYIILLYSFAIVTVEGIQTLMILLIRMYSMVVFLMALFVISRAGQKVQNSWVQLRQKLCELCLDSLENEQYYKLVKDLLRCVRTHPVRVHVFGTLDVNMSMLPSIVAFFTSYTMKAESIYFFSVTGFSIYIIISSLYYSKRFYKLLSNFDAFYKNFDDGVYFQRMSKAQKVLALIIVLFISIQIIVSFSFQIFLNEGNQGLVATTVSQFNVTNCDFRYVFQYFTLHCILFVISEQLRTLTRSIDSEISAARVNRRSVEHAENLVSAQALDQDRLNKLDKWVKAYENINDSSNLCNSMFSVQLTIMLLIVTTYYIILLYSIAKLSFEGVQFRTLTSLLMNVMSLVSFFLALFVVSRAGQNVENSSLELRQKLCELCVYSLENVQYYKLAKDLLRCVRTRPIRVHMCGNLDVNMSLLPSVVAFFTSYTVIALQFNNVV